MTPQQTAAIAKQGRTIYANTAYRWLVGCALMIAGFKLSSDYGFMIACAIILVNQGFAAVVHVIQVAHTTANAVDDEAERKTRHTIQLAAARQQANEPVDEPFFWADVESRVRAERAIKDDPADKPVGFWKSTGLVSAAVLWQLFSDLVGLAIAAAIAGG